MSPCISIFPDENNDSEISWNEFLAFHVQANSMLNCWTSVVVDVSKIRSEFSNIDTDGSGTISKEEFVRVTTDLITDE